MLLALTVVGILVVVRSLVFVMFEQAQFDADQAVMGLTAKHISQGRAFPVFQYAQHYVLVIEAWLAAPFVAAFGTSVSALRLPLVLLNVAAGWLLVWLFSRELGLRPLVAVVPALFFVAAPPVLAAELVTALGGNIEPFVYVLLLWVVRDRPAIFGVVFAVGFLNREFTAYAVSALLAVEGLRGRLWQPDGLRRVATAAVVAVLCWQGIGMLNARADVFGPGTATYGYDLPPSNLSILTAFICPDIDIARMAANLGSLVTTQMATLLGTAPFELRRVNIASPTSQGLPGVWPVFSVVLVAALVRLTWVRWNARSHGPSPRPESAALDETDDSRREARPGLWFAGYLALIGVQSGVVWAFSRCGALSPLTLRYALLMVLLPAALVAAFLAAEPRPIWRSLMIAFVVEWSLLSLLGHADLLAYYRLDAAPSEYRLLTNELVARGVRYVRSDYWAAYMIDFLSDEGVTATANDYVRVAEYEDVVSQHPDAAIEVSRRPCAGGERFRGWYLCTVAPPR